MRILITGAAGYIGSVLTPALLAAGHSVRAVDRFIYGNHLSLAACAADPAFELFADDACDPDTMRGHLAWADAVLPLAALVGAPACDRDPNRATATNWLAVNWITENLSPQQLLVWPNTNSAYGAADGDVDEGSPLAPLSHYARTKQNAEGAVLAAGGVSLRLATAFGASPRMRLDLLVNDFVRRAVRDSYLTLYEPGAVRSVVHVRDMAAAFAFAIDEYDRMRGQAFNVVGANVTKLGLCEAIRDEVPTFGWHVADGADPDRRDARVSAARLAALGFAPRHTLPEGIAELAKLLHVLPKTAHGNI